MRFCFDLDKTILNEAEDYCFCTPKRDVVAYMQELHALGHTIIIYTARKMHTHEGNLGKVIQDIGMLTAQQIETFKIPCDELYFGKPAADVYIDDKAVNGSSLEHFKEYTDGLLS